MNKPVLFLLSLSFSLPALSQQIVLKPAAGFNSLQFSGDAGKYSYPRTGFQAGASAAFGGKFYVEPGLFYVDRKRDYLFIVPTTLNGGPPEKQTQKMSGWSVPLAIGYKLIGGDHPRDLFGLRVFGGGSAFFLHRTDQSVYYNKTQWGVFAGAGADFAFAFIDAKYDWSLSKVSPNPAAQSFFGLSRPQTFYLNLGVRIPVGKKG